MAGLILPLPSLPPVTEEAANPPRYREALLEELEGAPGVEGLVLTGRWYPTEEVDVYWLSSDEVQWWEGSLGPEEYKVLEALSGFGVQGPIDPYHLITEYLLSQLEEAVPDIPETVRAIASCPTAEEALERYGSLMEDAGYHRDVVGILWGIFQPRKDAPLPPDLAALAEEAEVLADIPSAPCVLDDDTNGTWHDAYDFIPWMVAADTAWASTDFYHEIWDEHLRMAFDSGLMLVHQSWRIASEEDARRLGRGLKAALRLKEWLLSRFAEEVPPSPPVRTVLPEPPPIGTTVLRRASLPALWMGFEGLMEAKGGLVEALFD